jgi:hypothetical protein
LSLLTKLFLRFHPHIRLQITSRTYLVQPCVEHQGNFMFEGMGVSSVFAIALNYEIERVNDSRVTFCLSRFCIFYEKTDESKTKTTIVSLTMHYSF